MSENSPFYKKPASEIRDDLLEEVVGGIVNLQDELHRNDVANKAYSDDSPPLTYRLQCGLPEVAGILTSVSRIWGVKNNTFKEFDLTTDYTINTITNDLVFESGQEPDSGTEFFVTYKYNQGYTSGITHVARGTVTDSIISAVSFKISELYNAIALAKVASFIDEALGDDLDQLVKLINVTRKSASKSSGFVTVFRGTISGTVAIPAGTQFSTDATSTKNPVIFESTELVNFIDGFSSARVPIEAITGYEGKGGNVAPNLIKNINTPTSGIIRVNNPETYVDYEFEDMLIGKYNYSLENLPERVINSGISFPLAITDKGVYSVMYWTDKSINEPTWFNNDSPLITVTENDPETGTTKVVVTGSPSASTYLTIIGQTIPRDDTTQFTPGYDHVIIRIRSTAGATFSIILRDGVVADSTASLYKLGDAGAPTTTPAPDTIFEIFYGGHGLGGTPTDPIIETRIKFNTAGTFYIDYIGIGTIIEEIQGALSAVDQISTSYTSGKFALWQSTPDDFFSAYDGDSSDGHSDQLLIFYEWKNNVAGGQDEETDDELRARAKIEVAGLGTGTKSAIRRALLEIDGISQAVVRDFDDDPNIVPGDTYCILLAEGFKVSPSLSSEIVSVIEANRAAGIRATVFLPEIRYINFDINIIYDDTLSEYQGVDGRAALEAIVLSVIADYFDTKIVVDRNLYWSDMVAYLIREIEGVQGGYIDYNVNLVTGSDGVSTISTGTFTSATGGFVAAGIATDDTIIITTGNDAGTYKVVTRDSDTQLTVTPTFANGDTGESFALHREPTYVDDDFDGTYVCDILVLFANHVSATKTGASIVVQGGDTINVTLIGASTL
jgi:hypothetical protein